MTRIFLFLLLAVFALELFYIARIALFAFIDPSSTPYMRQEEDRLSENAPHPVRYSWVDYDKISPYMKSAVVAAEDADFMHHNGLQWGAILTAAQRNLLSERHAPGGSTLTQQTIKNLFLSHDRSYFRKIQEIILAPIVEALWSKKRILEVYLNIAEFGNGIFGVEAASRAYFHKSASQLDRNEAIRLASILINPKKYHINSNSSLIQRRVHRIANDMRLVDIPKNK